VSSECFDVIRKEFFRHSVRLLGQSRNVGDPKTELVLQRLHLSFGIMIILLVKLNSGPKHLWRALYMFLSVSQCLGDSDVRIYEMLTGYFGQKAQSGTPFVDPEWRRMRKDLKSAGLEAIFEDAASEMVFQNSVFDWSEGKLGHKLVDLPHRSHLDVLPPVEETTVVPEGSILSRYSFFSSI
jgi:hypothetical protein